MTLLSDLEQATKENQHVVIYDVLVFAHKEGWLSDGQYDRAVALRNAGAYLEVALMLVPEGRGTSGNLTRQHNDGWWSWGLWRFSDLFTVGSVCVKISPALVCCIAALRARQEEGE